MIAVDIARARPAQRRTLEGNLDPRHRRDGLPTVLALGVEHEGAVRETRRKNADPAAKARWNRNRRFGDRDREFVAVPRKGTGSDDEPVRGPVNRAPPPLGHRPAFSGSAVQCYIDGAMIQRIADAAPPGPGIVGRKDAADEGDQRQPVAAVVAQRIDIPPGIATRCHRLVEARSAIRLAAAWRPESAAIGTPGPGCALPPAR